MFSISDDFAKNLATAFELDDPAGILFANPILCLSYVIIIEINTAHECNGESEEMIKNANILQQFNDTWVRTKKPLPYSQSLKIFTAMWEEGVKRGVLPPKDPLEGIETDIRIAAVLNSCLKNSCQK